jgi:hypothetical protein
MATISVFKSATCETQPGDSIGGQCCAALPKPTRTSACDKKPGTTTKPSRW